MMHVLACVTQEHEPWLVALAALVCLAGAFTYVRLLRSSSAASGASWRWLAGAGAVAGGGAVWATHFIAMLAHRLGTPLAFDAPLTFASVVVAVLVTWVGLGVAAVGRGRPWGAPAGGCLVGLGVGAMHHMGMLALAVPGALAFDPAYAACSVAIGCALSGASAWVAVRRGDGPHHAAAAVLFTLAVVGLHFTGMTGTAVVLDGRPVQGWAPDGPWLAVAVAVAAALILAACAGVPIVEQNFRLRAVSEARLRELSTQGVRFQAALDNMTQGLCLFDAQGRLVVHNRRFAAMFGPPAADADAAGPALLADGRFGDMFGSPGAAGGGPDGHVHELPDGRVIRVSRQAIPGAGWVATYEDVTERRRSREQLSHMARHDALTGLPNRVKFRERMEQVLLRAPRGGLAVLYLDLDGFKGVNDTLGHPAGDELLRMVAARLQECTRGTDLVARLGGDEFAIIQADAQQPEDAAALAARLVQAVREPFDISGHRVAIGTSIGIALADEAATADGLLRNADIALYRAKAAGRGAWRFFEARMDAEMQARSRLEADLRLALAEGQFEVFYQPLIDAGTEGLTGLEALLRWNHPERGLVSPAEFIPVAEEIGLIGGLGAWVLRQACADAAGWPLHVKVAVNLSPAQFRTGDLVREVEHALAGAGLAASRLELEITEFVLLRDNDADLGILHRLRGLGVRIAMDDFGTGYSSLGYLRRFPFDKIKIDESFVRNCGVEKGSIEIIRAVVGLAQALGMGVLAEGVETAEQLRMLQAEGCDELQGYLFSRPRPLRDVPDLIAARPPARACDGSAGARPAGPRLALVGGQPRAVARSGPPVRRLAPPAAGR